MIVDKGAKVGAALHPQDEEILTRTRQAEAVVYETAKFLGRMTEHRWESNKLELKAAAKRAHPRIGVLSTAAEGVFEVRCASRWQQALGGINNDCMALEVRLAEHGAILPLEEISYDV